MTSLRHNNDAGERREDAYLDAARACILDVGWRRTTLTEVARRAGVSRMTIYRTWSDMPQLLADLMTREWGGVVTAAVTGAVPDGGGPDGGGPDGGGPGGGGPGGGGAVDRLVGSVVATVRRLRENELFVRIVELDPELLLPYLLARRGRSQEAILARLVAAVRAGQAAGEVRDGNPVAIARGLLLAAHGFVLSAQTMVDDDVSEEELDAELARLLTRSLQP